MKVSSPSQTNELTSKGIKDYLELSFGESLSKVARHELALLCLQAIKDELKQNPTTGKGRGRGRPPSPMGILATRMGVNYDTVKRWANLKEIQASDFNSEKLAIMAYAFDSAGVERILQNDVARRRETMDKWLKEAEANYPLRPYVENSYPRHYGNEILPDELEEERSMPCGIIPQQKHEKMNEQSFGGLELWKS